MFARSSVFPTMPNDLPRTPCSSDGQLRSLSHNRWSWMTHWLSLASCTPLTCNMTLSQMSPADLQCDDENDIHHNNNYPILGDAHIMTTSTPTYSCSHLTQQWWPPPAVHRWTLTPSENWTLPGVMWYDEMWNWCEKYDEISLEYYGFLVGLCCELRYVDWLHCLHYAAYRVDIHSDYARHTTGTHACILAHSALTSWPRPFQISTSTTSLPMALSAARKSHMSLSQAQLRTPSSSLKSDLVPPYWRSRDWGREQHLRSSRADQLSVNTTGHRAATVKAMIKRWLSTVEDTHHCVRRQKVACIQNNVSRFLCIYYDTNLETIYIYCRNRQEPLTIPLQHL